MKNYSWLEDHRRERLQHSSRNPGLSALMSFFVMGMGQIYAGHIDKGIILLVIQLGGALAGFSVYSKGLVYDLLVDFGGAFLILPVCYFSSVVLILLWIYNIKDAYYLSLFSEYRDWFEVERVLLPVLKDSGVKLLSQHESRNFDEDYGEESSSHPTSTITSTASSASASAPAPAPASAPASAPVASDAASDSTSSPSSTPSPAPFTSSSSSSSSSSFSPTPFPTASREEQGSEDAEIINVTSTSSRPVAPPAAANTHKKIRRPRKIEIFEDESPRGSWKIYFAVSVMLILIGIGLFNISAHFQKGNDTPGILFSLNGEIQTHGNALGGIGLASGQSNVLTREVAAFAQNGNTDGGYKASLAPRPVGDSGLASDTGSAGDTGIVSGPGAPGDPGLAGGPARTTSDAVERGLAMIGNGEIASGIAVLEAVSQRQNGLDSLAWKTLLQTYFSHDLMAAYEDCIGRYLQANPDDLEEWVNLAKVQYDRQAFVAASRSILKALNRDPNHQRANFLMGTIYRELGLPEEALPYLNRALKTDPLNTEFNREVAAAYIEIKDLKSARRHLERAMSVTVNAGTRDEEAERLMAQLENQEKLELPAYGQATLSDPVSIGAPEMELPKISGDPVMGGSTVAVSGSHPGMGGKVLYEAPDWNPEGVRVTIPPTVRKSRDVSARALTIDVTRENTSSPTKFGNQDPEVGIHPAIPATQTTSANSANSANSATPKTSVPTPTISATPQTSATSTITVTPTTPETSATIAIPTTSPTLASLANPATAATTATVIPNPLEHVFSEFVGKAFPGAASNSASNSSAIAVAPVAGHEETVSGIHEAEKRKSAALEKPPAPVLPDGSGRPPTPLAIAASSSEKIGEGSAKGSNKASAKGSDEGSAKGSTKGSSKGSAGGSSADSDESLSNFFVGYPERNGRGAGSGSEDLANSVAIEDRKAERGKKPTTAGLKPRAESTKAAGKASADDNLKRLWAKGFENYLAGRWEQALPSFLSYLEKREDPRVYDMVGIIFEKLKLEHDSFDAVMSAYRLGQKDPQTLVRIGLLAEKIGNFSKGVEFLEQAKAKLPHRVDLKIHLARCYKGSGNSAEAREILRKVVADPQQSYAVKRSAELDLALIDKPGSR